MKDEEIKLPVFDSFGSGKRLAASMSKYLNWQADKDAQEVMRELREIIHDYAREAVRLNQPQAEPLPFNIEAAKRGDVVVYGNDYLRWIGISQHHKGMNVLEGANGLTYAADCDLFMKPKPMRTIYLVEYESGHYKVEENYEKANAYSMVNKHVHELNITDVR